MQALVARYNFWGKELTVGAVEAAFRVLKKLVDATKQLYAATLDVSDLPLFICHIHDEASFRVRSTIPLAPTGEVDMEGLQSAWRSGSSKVQNHHVTLSFRREKFHWRSDWPTELEAMQKKDAPTIATTLKNVVDEIVATTLDGRASVGTGEALGGAWRQRVAVAGYAELWLAMAGYA